LLRIILRIMTKRIRKNLSVFRSVFFREKYRFDQGNAFLVFLNFALLVISLVTKVAATPK